MKAKTKTLSATEFKAKCLRTLYELGPQGIVVTKKGPARRQSNADGARKQCEILWVHERENGH